MKEIVLDYQRYRDLRFTRREALSIAFMRARARKQLNKSPAPSTAPADRSSWPRP